MASKFMIRTIRNFVSRARPYFAHLAITHRCNLRCRFCHVPDERFEELDLEGMKRIIDALDRLGVAILSISGGGEPLLREDFAEIVDYAAGKGLYTKLTSNGTMPLGRYRKLLDSRVSEIGISLDGVEGNDLPYSHVSPRILQTIRYLNDNLPKGKQLTLNVTVSNRNRAQVDEIVDYCTREFPNARIWLNPVVVGSGKLRRHTEDKVNPDYLRRVDSPTLVKANFFTRGAEEQYRCEKFNWGCLAGRFSFDIKPNGDFWLCQDQPCHTPLNILDPDFAEKHRKADFGYREECSGCTYSCYFVTQKLFEPNNWPDVARIWWRTATEPNERCRDVARKYGWLAGLLYFSVARISAPARNAGAALLILLALAGLLPLWGQEAPPAMIPDEIVAKMEECNSARQKALQSYSSLRRYEAGNSRLRRQASVLVEMQYTAPDVKSFRVVESTGSRTIQDHVISPLLVSERETARRQDRQDVDITRQNYTFTLSGRDEANGAYIFTVKPRKNTKYLFRGKIWIDEATFGIMRIEGEPAKSPSFYVRKVRFVHEYARFGDFWFPVSNRTVAELWIFGKSSLNIDYYGYEWHATVAVSAR